MRYLRLRIDRTISLLLIAAVLLSGCAAGAGQTLLTETSAEAGVSSAGVTADGVPSQALLSQRYYAPLSNTIT